MWSAFLPAAGPGDPTRFPWLSAAGLRGPVHRPPARNGPPRIHSLSPHLLRTSFLHFFWGGCCLWDTSLPPFLPHRKTLLARLEFHNSNWLEGSGRIGALELTFVTYSILSTLKWALFLSSSQPNDRWRIPLVRSCHYLKFKLEWQNGPDRFLLISLFTNRYAHNGVNLLS